MRTVINHQSDARSDVSVNEVVIASADIAREVQNHSGGSPLNAWEEATRALVIRELLLQRAQTSGITAEPQSENGLRETEDEALIRGVLAAEVRTPTADEATCRRYYEVNLARFRSPDLFEPVHILFQASQADESGYATALERATAALQLLGRSPERFGELAQSLSDCSSAADQGRLGQVTLGETTPEFEAAMIALEPGERCAEPVRTRYGVHVIRVDRKVVGQTLPFEQVRERIAAYLEASSWHRAVAQYISLLAGHARIAGYEMAGASSPLVQ